MGNFFFTLVSKFPMNFFLHNLGHFLLVPPSVWRANLGLALFGLSLMSWYCSRFGSAKVSHN